MCMCMCMCIYLSIHPSIHRSIDRSIDLSIHLSIYLSLCVCWCMGLGQNSGPVWFPRVLSFGPYPGWNVPQRISGSTEQRLVTGFSGCSFRKQNRNLKPIFWMVDTPESSGFVWKRITHKKCWFTKKKPVKIALDWGKSQFWTDPNIIFFTGCISIKSH